MPRRNNMMLAVANFELATHYLASWLLNYYNRIGGLSKRILLGEEMTRSNLELNIDSFDPYLVVLGGHGAADRLGGQHNQIVLDFSNVDITNGRIMYVFSCVTAAQLGVEAVAEGCVSYIGYSQDFVFIIDEASPSPLTDRYARWFFEPGCGIMNSIATGSTTRGAVDTAKRGFQSGVNYWTNKDDPEAPFMLSSLEQDRDVLTLHGDENATLSGFALAGGGLMPLIAVGAAIQYIYSKGK